MNNHVKYFSFWVHILIRKSGKYERKWPLLSDGHPHPLLGNLCFYFIVVWMVGFSFVWYKVLCLLLWLSGTFCVDQAGLELTCLCLCLPSTESTMPGLKIMELFTHCVPFLLQACANLCIVPMVYVWLMRTVLDTFLSTWHKLELSGGRNCD